LSTSSIRTKKSRKAAHFLPFLKQPLLIFNSTFRALKLLSPVQIPKYGGMDVTVLKRLKELEDKIDA
jgi:hypothetical protein